MSAPSVLVVGGGISGLATAWWLARRGLEVDLWEAASLPGGKIRSTCESGYLREQAAGLLVNYRPEVDQLILESGLAARRQQRDPFTNRYLVQNGRLACVPMQIPDLFRSPLWSRRGKLRMMAELLIPKGGGKLESVSEFITRRFGREILETAIEPFIAGTLASDPDLAIAQAVLPRLTRLEQHYGSVTMGMLVNRLFKRRRANGADTFSFSGGMSALIDTLSATPGIRVHNGRSVEGIEYRQRRWFVRARDSDGVTRHAEPAALVLATPANVASGLLHNVDETLATQLDAIDYAPVGVVHLGMREQDIAHPLDGSGFLVARGERLGFNGNLWMSSLFPDRAPAGRALLTCYIGGARDPDRLQHSDQRIVENLLQELTPLIGIRGAPEYLHIDRHPQALPLYHVDYLQRVACVQERMRQLPGLHICANYVDGVSVRERIYAGSVTAAQIAGALQQSRKPASCTLLKPSPG